MSVKKVIIDLLYPRRCPLCNEVLPYQSGYLCEPCKKQLKWVEQPCCMKCGKPIQDEELEYCEDCISIPKSFVRGYPAFVYEGAIKHAIYDFKYQNQRSYAQFFALAIWKQYEETLKQLGIEAIVPVPVHKRKKRARGYNQAELLAKELGRLLEVPVYKDYLVRITNTTPQKELNDRARMKNLKSAFIMRDNTIKLKKIMLVDDIYTSGATIEACTQAIHQDEDVQVYYTSIAIGKGYTGL